jgi:hypothetical protein
MRQMVVASTVALATICLAARVVQAQSTDAPQAEPGAAPLNGIQPSHVNGQVWLMAGEPSFPTIRMS